MHITLTFAVVLLLVLATPVALFLVLFARWMSADFQHQLDDTDGH